MIFSLSYIKCTAVLAIASSARAIVYNTFDGAGFPACSNVAKIAHPTTINEVAAIVKDANAAGIPVRASGVAHSWYDTMCSDDPRTIIIQTNAIAGISDFDFPTGASEGTVWIEAGVTFFEIADYLHARNASIGYSLVNWNITIEGAFAMGAHRSSLSTGATVASAVLAVDIIKADGTIVRLTRATDGATDDWLAASCSLGLLGVVARLQLRIFPEFKITAYQTIIDEDKILNGDIPSFIAPYPTANFWWWPGLKKFHHRYYVAQPIDYPGLGFQSTFSISDFDAGAGKTLLDAGVFLAASNKMAEGIFFAVWSLPNFHTKDTDKPITTWPVTGFSQDNLIGGLYPGTKTEWEKGLHGFTFELAFPIPQANKMLQRVRQLLDASAAAGKPMTSTYRSGINIKFINPTESLLGQSSTVGFKNAVFKDGAIALDWPTYHPPGGIRFNEPFYRQLSDVLLREFPDARPHWTKNTREVFVNATRNLDQDILDRFAAVRQRYDPKGTFRSIVGQILGVV